MTIGRHGLGCLALQTKEMNVRSIHSPSIRKPIKFSGDRLTDSDQLLVRDDFVTNYNNTTGNLPLSEGLEGSRFWETDIVQGIDDDGASDGVCSVKRIVDCLPRTAVLWIRAEEFPSIFSLSFSVPWSMRDFVTLPEVKLSILDAFLFLSGLPRFGFGIFKVMQSWGNTLTLVRDTGNMG